VVDGSVRPWLLATTTNVSLNQRRSARRHRAFLSRLPQREDSRPAAEHEALTRADLDIDPELVTLIRSLSRTDQALIALVALEGYPLRDAAHVLEISEPAARSRRQRARRRLGEYRSTDPCREPANPI
jgi:RNA polymerase sigma-70 factor (ECF subfamily)